ncbi:MAG: type IX secretion system membrane protein PorP/SprF [Saprospiraceae bacterium]
MRVALIIILTVISLSSWGQQLPLYSNYNFNMFGINPAVAGSQSCVDLRIGHRKQWLGFEGEPTTSFVGAHGAFGKKRYSFHGAGLYLENDVAGPLERNSVSAAYAYHIKVNRKNMLSMGLSLGLTNIQLDENQLNVEDFLDPLLAGSQAETLFPQIGIGLWYQNQDRFIGLSVKNVNEPGLTEIGDDSALRRHIFLTAGKSIAVDKKLFFKPSVNLRSVSGSPIAADVNLLFDYNDLFEFGASFRGGHGISGMVKVGLLRYLTLGYAYDMTLNKLRLGARNTHEVMLGIQACPRGSKKGIPCSAYD